MHIIQFSFLNVNKEKAKLFTVLSVGCTHVGTGFLHLPVISKLQSNLQSYQFHNNYFEKDLSLNTMKKWIRFFPFTLWV